MLALIENDQVIRFPYSLEDLRVEHPETLMAPVPDLPLVLPFGTLVEVELEAMPAIQSDQVVSRSMQPSKGGDAWVLGWDVTTKSAAQLADERAQIVAKARADGKRAVDDRHAVFLVEMTRNETKEERDTWAPKEAAARAFQAGNATTAQTAMLTHEANDRNITVAQHAATIIARADQFMVLIGVAGGIHAKGRALIEDACADSVPTDQIPAQVATALQQMDAMIAAAKNA